MNPVHNTSRDTVTGLFFFLELRHKCLPLLFNYPEPKLSIGLKVRYIHKLMCRFGTVCSCLLLFPQTLHHAP